MQKLSKQDKNKLAAVKSYLERYLIAKESAEAVDELNTHTKEDLTNPPINGRGYSMRSGNTKSEGAAAPVIHSENINPFCEQESQKIKKIMDEITHSLGLLNMTRGKTILIKIFLSGQSEREICREMKISHDTFYKHKRRAMLQLYEILIKNGRIDPV